MKNDYNPSIGGDNNNGKLIDTIMASQYQEELANINLNNMVNKAFGGLKRKQRHVLKRRFGLGGINKKTLQEIGDSYGVTRERIRQIEKAALKKLAKEANFKYFSPITSLAVFELSQAGGILSENSLVKKMLADNYDENSANSLRLIFEVHPEMNLVKECDHKHESWMTADFRNEEVLDMIYEIVNHLDSHGKPMSIEGIHERLTEKFTAERNLVESLLDIAKNVMETEDNQYGLVSWSFINPKNIRDKIYYVLQKEKNPLHFMDITELITKEDFLNKKRVTPQAVHNELIADDRYVLIGKGIYALRDWGYSEGTVGDVIEAIIKSTGEPLLKEDIIEEVMKRRMVKKNTIVINLHNKNRFKRTKDGKFLIKDKK